MRVNLKILLFSFSFAILSFLVSSTKVYASTLFSDNFSDPSKTYTQWIVEGTAGWQVAGGQYGIHLNPGLSNTYPSNNVWNSTWNNYDLQLDLIGTYGTDKNVMFRYIDNSNFYEIHHSGGIIYFDKHYNGNDIVLSSYSYPLNNYISYHIEILANNNNIKVKINNEQIMDVYDNTQPILTGRIGLRVGTGGVPVSEVWYDNVIVTTLDNPTPTPSPSPTPTPTPLPFLNVADIKQYTLPWGNEVYDHAISWSTNPFIKRWGCALTSVDMILRYYGFSINPSDLNKWLINQPDGYLGNGNLNWLAISRYTAKTTNPGVSLEFKRIPATNENLINELTNNRPAILEEPGHFVVAYSQTEGSFGINDPAYTNHPTLSSYENNSRSIETYIPSHTNLSYIMLTINPNFDLKVFDPDGHEITTNTFLQDPLIDDFGGINQSGSSLKIFQFPKPPNGIYRVQITGIGIYELNSYLYDQYANVNLTKIKGIVGNDTDYYQLVVGNTNSTNQVINIDKIKKDWADAYKLNYIKSSYIYNEVNSLLNTATKMLSVNQKSGTKIALDAAMKFIKIYTPTRIDPAVSNIIQSEINTLINSL